MVYITHRVDLSEGQANKLAKAVADRSPITIKFKASQLNGTGIGLLFTANQMKRINRAIADGTGAQIKFSASAIAAMKKDGGILPILAALAPLGIALLSGALGAVGTWGANKVIKKIEDSTAKDGGRLIQTGGEVKRKKKSSDENLGGKLYQLGTAPRGGCHQCGCGGSLTPTDYSPSRKSGGKLFPLGVRDTRNN